MQCGTNIPLSLYVHIPWCVRKCPYCDFNSHPQRGELPEAAYIDTLLRDLDSSTQYISGRAIKTIFIGGGTPSLFSGRSISKLLQGIGDTVPLEKNLEITLEANPGTVEQSRFDEYHNAGINRLSIGVQSFCELHLKNLGRIHSSEEAIRAAQSAKKAGIDNFNLDLMFGLQNQTIEDALTDLKTAIALNPKHISWYQLTLEPNTLFYTQKPQLPDDDIIWEMQALGQKTLATHGYHQYEVSAYCQKSFECQHNLNYWQFGDYLGIGAGAHGKISKNGKTLRYWKHKHPKKYMAHLTEGKRELKQKDLIFEFMLNALRLNKAIPFNLFETSTGISIETIRKALTIAEGRKLIKTNHQAIKKTEQGQRFLNDLIEIFLS